VAGISYSLRQIALISEVAADMKARCPQAWLLDIANPLPRVTQAAHELGVQTAGFCSVSLESYAMLARVGITGTFAPLALYGAAALDIAFGLGTLFLRNRRLLWIAQATLICMYTLTITVYLPEFWLHPFGPLAKNLPILAVIWLLYELEKR